MLRRFDYLSIFTAQFIALTLFQDGPLHVCTYIFLFSTVYQWVELKIIKICSVKQVKHNKPSIENHHQKHHCRLQNKTK